MENKLFGTDGIRGVACKDYLTIEQLDKVIGALLFCAQNIKNVIIGRDTRLSGTMLSNAISAIFSSYGVNVVDVEIAPTPAISFITKMCSFDLGVVISASHNSFEDNGVKFFSRNGCKLQTDLEEKITSAFLAGNIVGKKTHKNIGNISRRNLLKKYEDYILGKFALDLSQMRIVVDYANGAMYRIANSVFKKLQCNVIGIFNNPNGININENCGAVSPKNLCDRVRKEKADIGIAFDGDGDRLLVCDENGEIVDGDHLLGFFAKMAFSPKENKSVIISEMSNLGLENYLLNTGYSVIRTPVGDKYIAEKIHKKEALFGGENSGHIILGNYQETGDGLIAALKILELMKYENVCISKLVRDFQLLPNIKINVEVKDKSEIDTIVLNNIVKEFETNDVRILLRKSGTENLLRILVEGEEYEKISEIAVKIKNKIVSLYM